jgi:hypothetical protein
MSGGKYHTDLEAGVELSLAIWVAKRTVSVGASKAVQDQRLSLLSMHQGVARVQLFAGHAHTTGEDTAQLGQEGGASCVREGLDLQLGRLSTPDRRITECWKDRVAVPEDCRPLNQAVRTLGVTSVAIPIPITNEKTTFKARTDL